MNQIEKKVLEIITPSLEYKKKIDKLVNEINGLIKQEIKKRNLPVTIELVGSIAKDTYLKDDLDIDFFLKFPTKYQKEKIGENALLIGRTILKNTKESYAEHPYIRGYYKKYKVEIVPCYKIENVSQRLSAVDRTPLHTKYVKKNLAESKKLDVRLFKQFLKGIGCYGAEAEVEGFSGYLCEILIIKYDSFNNLIKNAQKWRVGEKFALLKAKYPTFDTPLTFIDPVDTNRNVASAISKEKFDVFTKACREYLKKPLITFFFPKKVKPWSLQKIKKELEKKDFQYLGVRIRKPDTIPENLYPQVRKAARSIWDICLRYDFTIFDVPFYVGDDYIYIIVKTGEKPLLKTQIHSGPPLKLKENASNFLKKWKDDPRVINKPYEKNGRLYVKIKREYTQIQHLLMDQINNLSLGKHIDQIVRKKCTFLELEDLLKENLAAFWTEYLNGKMPWER